MFTLSYLAAKLGRPSTAKGYRDIWEDHLQPLCQQVWLKDTRTYHVQGWLNQVGAGKLSRNTLKHVKSVISGIFTLAKQQDYFQAENPARDTAVNPRAAGTAGNVCLHSRGDPEHPCLTPGTRRYSFRSSSIHGPEARRNTRTPLGELPGR